MESLWCLLGFLILNYIVHKHRSFKGEIFVLYGVWYGVERMVVEGMRTDSLYIGSTSIRVSQVLSAMIAVVALVYFIVVMVKKKQGRLPQRLPGGAGRGAAAPPHQGGAPCCPGGQAQQN